ncbi:hypothetical protein J6590_014447 [Homalodisca vitripennis]|nr:hypothetical protein J6590_014447 [Homalodisca vitripennis]
MPGGSSKVTTRGALKSNSDTADDTTPATLHRLDRDEFLRCRKVRRHLKATDLGYSSENSIYINESLTPSTRELLKLTKARAKERNYSQVWTFNCSVFVRKDKGNTTPVIKILSVSDLDKM